MIEIIGYLAMALVAGSFLMKDLNTLRMVNTAGAMLFVIYAWLTSAWPVLGVNLFIVSINLYHLYRAFGKAK